MSSFVTIMIFFTSCLMFAGEATENNSVEPIRVSSAKRARGFTLIKSSEWRNAKTQSIKKRLKGYEHTPQFITVHHSAYRKGKPAKTKAKRVSKLKKKMRKSLSFFNERKDRV